MTEELPNEQTTEPTPKPKKRIRTTTLAEFMRGGPLPTPEQDRWFFERAPVGREEI